MIVKNEAHLIVQTLQHLARYIKFDYWAINDNGSTDGTQDLIRGYFKEANIPGVLDETPWQDFAFNRTVAFRAAFGKTDYAFVWDADDEIHGDFRLPETLTADSYMFTYGNASGARYSRCQLFKNSLQWKYVGVIHEFPVSDEPDLQQIQECVEGDYYFVSGRTGARNRDPYKYLNDALILEKAFYEAVEKKDGILNRYAFYTAQSYNSCARHEKAIEFYKKVLTLENWAQEKYMSCIEIFDQYAALKKEEEGLRYLVESFRYDSRRIEGIYRLIKYYCIYGPVEVAMAYYTLIQNYLENEYVDDNIATRLFAKKEEYDFYLPYHMVIVSERVKRFDIFKKMYEIIFRQSYLHAGAWWIHNLFHNLQFGIPSGDPAFVEAALTYVDKLRKHGIPLNQNHYEILDRVVAASRPALAALSEVFPKKDSGVPVRVMLTITTCKRLALFKETMNSIMRTWRDISAIDYFFCVDDNSSAEDRHTMQTEYPFFDYYMKGPAEKGHRESMNVIWNKLREIKPAYWIHIEDDWLYFKQESYVTRSIALLEKYEDQGIHQLVFNREYGLMLKDMNRTSVEPLETGVVLHSQKEVDGPNCAYWPHYSMQPSIVRTRIILELGNYDSPNAFFERDYANKYGAAGYKTMFFDGIYSLHIGKQHWEKDGHNAYTLNGVGQFAPTIPTLVITEIPKHKRNLIYFSVFYNDDYFRLAKLLLKSLHCFSSTDTFDILLLTASELSEKAEELAKIVPIKICYLPLTTFFQAACARLSVFDYAEIHQYDKILYLDTDIIIKKDLTPVFSTSLEDKLYGLESGTISSLSFGAQFFDYTTIDRDTTGINSGTLLFNNCSVIRELFKRIQTHIAEFTDTPPYCMDQPFINYHAIKDGFYNNQMLKSLVSLYEDDDAVDNYATSIICHFSFPIGNSEHKYTRMSAFFKRILEEKSEDGMVHIGEKTFTWGPAGTIHFGAANHLKTTWGHGGYEVLGNRRVRAIWNNHVHILTFTANLSDFTSVRIHPLDFDIVVGQKS